MIGWINLPIRTLCNWGRYKPLWLYLLLHVCVISTHLLTPAVESCFLHSGRPACWKYIAITKSHLEEEGKALQGDGYLLGSESKEKARHLGNNSQIRHFAALYHQIPLCQENFSTELDIIWQSGYLGNISRQESSLPYIDLFIIVPH